MLKHKNNCRANRAADRVSHQRLLRSAQNNEPGRLQLIIVDLAWLSVPWTAFSKFQFPCTVYPKKYAHGFVVLCFVVVMQSFIMNSHEVFSHIHQGCFAGTGAIVRLPQCQWSKPDGYGKIRQCITTTKHSKAITVCIFLGIYCTFNFHLRYCNNLPNEINYKHRKSAH